MTTDGLINFLEWIDCECGRNPFTDYTETVKDYLEFINENPPEAGAVVGNESEKVVCEHDWVFVGTVADCYCNKCKQWQGL